MDNEKTWYTGAQMEKLRRENDELKFKLQFEIDTVEAMHKKLDTARIEANKIVMQLSETNREYGALEAERDNFKFQRDELDKLFYRGIAQRGDARRWSAAWKAAAKENRARYKRCGDLYVSRTKSLCKRRDELKAELNDARRWARRMYNEREVYVTHVAGMKRDYDELVAERDLLAPHVPNLHEIKVTSRLYEIGMDNAIANAKKFKAERDYLADRVLELQGYKTGSHTTGTGSKSYTVPGTVNAGDPPVECVPAVPDKSKQTARELLINIFKIAGLDAPDEWLDGLLHDVAYRSHVPDCKTDDDMTTFDSVGDMNDWLIRDKPRFYKGDRVVIRGKGIASTTYEFTRSADYGDDLRSVLKRVETVPTIEHDWVWEHGAETWLWEGEDE